jgi:hypothetical protein
MKIMSQGETMASSTQFRSKVPLGVSARFGLLYLAVAAGKLADFADTTALTFGGSSDR